MFFHSFLLFWIFNIRRTNLALNSSYNIWGLHQWSVRQSPNGSKLGSACKKLHSRGHMVVLGTSSSTQSDNPRAKPIPSTLTVHFRHHGVLMAVIKSKGVLRCPTFGEVVARQCQMQVLHQAAIGGQRNTRSRSVRVFILIV